MAFQRILSFRVCTNIFRPVFLCHRYAEGTAINNQEITLEFDALDTFTTQLLQKRLDYLEIRHKTRHIKRSILQDDTYDVNVSSLTQDQLKEMISNALYEYNDFAVIKLVQECIKYDICPNKDVLLQLFYICAQKSEVDLIHGLKKLCIKTQVEFSVNFDFLLYEAHALWMKGNVIKALGIFEKLYMNNPFLRRHIRISLKQLISEGTKSNSEVILLHIVKFTENIVEKYKDYYPMVCVWEVCFQSQWFSDQQIALNLLNNNKKLADALIHRLPCILYSSLRNHGTEVIYRLLEVMLDFQMKEHYLMVIMALLDYHFLQQNVRSYSEVIKWCKLNDLTLPRLYNEKYLKLLLNRPDKIINWHPSKSKGNDYTLSF